MFALVWIVASMVIFNLVANLFGNQAKWRSVALEGHEISKHPLAVGNFTSQGFIHTPCINLLGNTMQAVWAPWSKACSHLVFSNLTGLHAETPESRSSLLKRNTKAVGSTYGRQFALESDLNVQRYLMHLFFNARWQVYKTIYCRIIDTPVQKCVRVHVCYCKPLLIGQNSLVLWIMCVKWTLHSCTWTASFGGEIPPPLLFFALQKHAGRVPSVRNANLNRHRMLRKGCAPVQSSWSLRLHVILTVKLRVNMGTNVQKKFF